MTTLRVCGWQHGAAAIRSGILGQIGAPNLLLRRYVKMALMLHYEQQRGEASRFWPYVSTLPSEYPVPMNWRDDELDQLQYPPLQSEVIHAAQSLPSLWRRICKNVSCHSNAHENDSYMWPMR